MKTVQPDELEVSVFGPGYGECILIHLGANQWILVDSCREAVSNLAAPLGYLRKIGLDPATCVRLVVATHWHDDHVRGLGDVLQVCSNARFVCASAMNTPEFITMVTRYEEAGPKTAVGSGVREMYRVFCQLDRTGRRCEFAAPNRLIFRCPEAAVVAGGSCEVTSLSPADKQIEMFWAEIAAQMPIFQQTIRRAVSKSPNHLAVALWITAGSEALLLGSDLQDTADAQRGWSVIARSAERPIGKAVVFKIPHHGSENGHNTEVWNDMVVPGAYALLTPFANGNVFLPTGDDVRRIVNRAGAAYLTANPQLRSPAIRSPVVARAIRSHLGRMKLAQPKMGHIRLRKRYGQGSRWYINLMAGAYRLGDRA